MKRRLMYLQKPSKCSTEKQKKLLKAVIAHPNAEQTELARLSGLSRQMVNNNLHDPRFQAKISAMMEGIPKLCRAKRLEHLADGLNATRTSCRVTGPGKKGGQSKTEFVEEPDLKLRLPYLELAFKLAGDLKPPEETIQGDKLSLALVIMQERERRGLDPMPSYIKDVTPEKE